MKAMNNGDWTFSLILKSASADELSADELIL
jgi:hypothetical protein